MAAGLFKKECKIPGAAGCPLRSGVAITREGASRVSAAKKKGPGSGRKRLRDPREVGTFYSEPVEVDSASVRPAALSRGAPACPMRFFWRGKEFRVARVLEEDRQLRAHDSPEKYVHSHSFRVITTCGWEMVLRCDRQIRGNPWRLFTARRLEDGEAPPGE